ncbi:MAG: thioredoxin family protein [Calditrichaeota bacterium]|nr:thioredoxin family protein [Calditrichota bacterium]
MKLTEWNLEQLDQALAADLGPLLAAFMAPWCEPCRTVAPLLEGVDEDFNGRVQLVRIDIEEHSSLASRYRIRAIPTLILFVKGAERGRIVGAAARTEIVKRVRNLML